MSTEIIREPTTDPVIERAGEFLLGLLAEGMVPELLPASDGLALAPPYQEQRDFRMGVYLYDLQDFTPVGRAAPERVGEGRRRLPPKAMELRYLIYVNQSVPFSPAGAREEEILLEAAARAIHSAGPLEFPGSRADVQFSFLQFSEKLSLWQSFSKPLQPAVYVTLTPVLIPSERLRVTPEVREVETHIRDAPRPDGA